MSDSEMKAIWIALKELQENIHKLEVHHVRQIDENRAVSRVLEDLEAKVKGLCKVEEMRWRNGYSHYMKDLMPESSE